MSGEVAFEKAKVAVQSIRYSAQKSLRSGDQLSISCYASHACQDSDKFKSTENRVFDLKKPDRLDPFDGYGSRHLILSGLIF